MKTLRYVMSAVVMVMLASCSKSSLEPQVNQPTEIKHSGARIDPYPLDWEGTNRDIMPTPSGIVIYSPWASGGTGGLLTSAFRNDIKRSDGWELLYNTFNTQALPPSLYFALYNKYRGVVRFYFYTYGNANQYVTSSDILHGISTGGGYAGNSPLLNYVTQAVVDVNSNITQTAITDPNQVGPNAWYAFEYELAYDSNIGGHSQADFYLNWIGKGMDTQSITLNGTETGDLKGSISVEAGGIDLSGNSVTINNRNGQVNVTGQAENSQNILAQLASAAFSGVKQAITGGVAGLVGNIFSGIFGSGNEDNTHLTLDSKISLSGSLKSSFLISPLTFGISGYDQSNTAGIVPAYNNPLGVFYISNKPTVKQTTYYQPQFGPNGEQLISKQSYGYQPDPSSFQLTINPAVLAIASIQNINYEIVISDTDQYAVGGKENVGGQTYITGTNVGVDNQQGNVIGTRVSFDVVPNDGNPRVKIVKTFTSTIQNTDITLPPGQNPW